MIHQRPVLWVLSKWLMQTGRPTLTNTGWYSGPLSWSPEMAPGVGQWSSVLCSKHRKPIWKQLTLAVTAAWMSLSWNKHINGKAEVMGAGGRIQQGGINSVFSIPGAREPSHPDMQWELSFNLPCLSITMTNNMCPLSNSFIVLGLLLWTDRKVEKIYSLKNRRKEQWGDLTHCLIVQMFFTFTLFIFFKTFLLFSGSRSSMRKKKWDDFVYLDSSTNDSFMIRNKDRWKEVFVPQTQTVPFLTR